MAARIEQPKDSDRKYMNPQFRSYLKDQRFRVVEILGDGNCLFRSIAFLVCGDQEKHERYRRLAVQYIIVNKNNFKDFLEESYDGDIDQYCKKMSQNGTWGGHLEVYALSSVLDQCFGIYNENKELQIIKGKNSSDMNILYLAFERAKFHYSYLVKIDHETLNQRGNPRKKRDRSEFKSQDNLHNNEKTLKSLRRIITITHWKLNLHRNKPL